MTRFLAVASLASAFACGVPRAEPEPLTEPSLDAGLAVTEDAGREPSAPCPAVPITRFCEGEVCWKNPAPMATEALTDVFAVGCQAWAVGPGGLLLERTDAGWRPNALLPYHARFNLQAVTGTAADDVWAVGDDALVHFDGRSWNHTSTGLGHLRATWTNERNTVFVAGASGVHRFSIDVRGLTVTNVFSAPSTTFVSVVGLGRTIVALATEAGSNRQAIWSYDGRASTREAVSDDVWLSRLAVHDGRVFGVGSYRHGSAWSGAHLTELFQRGPSASTDRAIGFFGMASRGPHELIVVGRGAPDSVMRFDGFGLLAIDGAPRGELTAAAEGGRDVFVVGELLGRIEERTWKAESAGPTQRFTSGVAFERETWVSGGFRSRDDGPFEPTFTERGQYLGDVAGRAPNDLLAIGSTGLMQFDGATWKRLAGGPSTSLQRLKVSLTGEAWAWNPAAVWTNASGRWAQVTLPGSVTVQDVLELPNGEAIVSATTQGNARLGVTWHVTSEGVRDLAAPAVIRHLAGLSATNVYAVADSGLLRLGASGWTRLSDLPTFNVLDVAMREDGTVAFVGMNGQVSIFTGSRFASRSVGSTVPLWGVSVTPTGSWLLVGSGGAVVELRW